MCYNTNVYVYIPNENFKLITYAKYIYIYMQ